MPRNLAIPALLLLAALAVFAHAFVEWKALVAPLVTVEPGPRSVVVFEETADRTPEQADTIEALHAYCDARTEHKTTYRHVDVSSAGDWKPHAERAKAVGLPAVIIWGDAELYAGRLPSTGDEAIALVKKWGG